ncbi:MAG: hypothetical protein JOZ78_02120 [Chroococcidiopsidaceae cyanobacterium CP_BM_ER_R8_30]|nr:hypothetical protein [Chroococcidiopsidaceae cyanobacterium CP_BM_ER_R8_30]
MVLLPKGSFPCPSERIDQLALRQDRTQIQLDQLGARVDQLSGSIEQLNEDELHLG